MARVNREHTPVCRRRRSRVLVYGARFGAVPRWDAARAQFIPSLDSPDTASLRLLYVPESFLAPGNPAGPRPSRAVHLCLSVPACVGGTIALIQLEACRFGWLDRRCRGLATAPQRVCFACWFSGWQPECTVSVWLPGWMLYTRRTAACSG